MHMWRLGAKRPLSRGVTGWVTNPWLLSAVGLAAASYVGIRMFRRA